MTKRNLIVLLKFLMKGFMLDMDIVFLNDLAKLPTRGSEEAAGWDLYAAIEDKVLIPPHRTVKIGTGLAIAVPNGFFGGLFPRSGIASREGLRPANCVGVIDSDYRGEVIAAIHNDSDEYRTILPGERIVQLIIMPYAKIDGFNVVENLDSTARGTGGFGSTGV